MSSSKTTDSHSVSDVVSNPQTNHRPLVFIGGSSPSGSGVLADARAAFALGVHACQSIVTAVTAQSHGEVLDTGVLPAHSITAQWQSLPESTQRVVKTGMLGSAENVESLVALLQPDDVWVIDPVLESSSGTRLLSEQGERALLTQLLPKAALVTPNCLELAALSGKTIDSLRDIKDAATELLAGGVGAVYVKGGHWAQDADEVTDYFTDGEHSFTLVMPRLPLNQPVRGTGCTFASAVAASLATGYALIDSVVLAKMLVAQAIRQAAVQGAASIALPTHWPDQLQDMPQLFWQMDQTENTYQLFSPVNRFASTGPAPLGLYPVVDSVEWLQRLIGLGVTTLQLRLKVASETVGLKSSIQHAVDLCQKAGVRLFINDHWRLAIQCGAYGVHLGQEDLHQADLNALHAAGLRLGVSSHSYYELARSVAIKPSYIAIGPVYPTQSKPMPWVPQGPAIVRQWVNLLSPAIPVVAIGGINLERARDLMHTGVDAIAVISAITEAHDYPSATKALQSVLQEPKVHST